MIIRPYKSYSPARLQLGAYEKEHWLYRALNGKDILIREETLDCKTSLTHSFDVALALAELIEKDSFNGETFQIASDETMVWRDVLKMYIDILNRHNLAKDVSVYTYKDIPEIDELFEGGYQIKYDCTWNRSFDSNKIEKELNHPIAYKSIKDGVSECLEEFLNNPTFGKIDETFESLCDEFLKTEKVKRFRL